MGEKLESRVKEGSVMSVHSLVPPLPYNEENRSSPQLVYCGYGDQIWGPIHARLALHHGAPVLALAPVFR